MDLENIMYSNSICIMISMLYFSYRDESLVQILRECDQEYQNLSSKTSLLYFTESTSSIILKEYNFGIRISKELKDLYSVANSICMIQDNLLIFLHQMQSSNQAMMKAYHKDLSKIVLTFDLDSKILDQNRHFFPFMERDFSAPYMLSNFHPTKEVTILDIISNQELREKVMVNRDLAIKNGKDYQFEFNKINYAIHVIYDYLHLKEVSGFMLTIETDSEKLLDHIMENSTSYGRTLKVKFKDIDELDQRIEKSLKFLNKVYGVSAKKVQEILKTTVELSNFNVSDSCLILTCRAWTKMI